MVTKEMEMVTQETNKRVLHSSLTLTAWLHKHIIGIVVLLSLLFFLFLIYLFGWWETLGILFLKFGLGAKVAGAKTLTHAIIKAGGKKAILIATAGMLTKRHIIDILSRFFTEHSVNRYKKNLTLVLKKKFDEIKESTLAKKLKAFGSMLLSIPMVYFFWTKVLGTAIQKFIYALFLPLITLIWNFLLTSFNFLNFIFQVFMLNLFLDTLARYKIGQKILIVVDNIVYFIGNILNFFNTILTYIGVDPKAWLVKLSNIFNRWLESILDHGLNSVSRLYNKRKRYVNIVEQLSEKRHLTEQIRRDKKSSNWILIKKVFERVVLKKRDWRESRAKRNRRWHEGKEKYSQTIRDKVIAKQARGEALTLPFHINQKIKRRRV